MLPFPGCPSSWPLFLLTTPSYEGGERKSESFGSEQDGKTKDARNETVGNRTQKLFPQDNETRDEDESKLTGHLFPVSFLGIFSLHS